MKAMKAAELHRMSEESVELIEPALNLQLPVPIGPVVPIVPVLVLEPRYWNLGTGT